MIGRAAALLVLAGPAIAGVSTVYDIPSVVVRGETAAATQPISVPSGTHAVSWSYTSSKPVLAQLCSAGACQPVAGARGRRDVEGASDVYLLLALPDGGADHATVTRIRLIASHIREGKVL